MPRRPFNPFGYDKKPVPWSSAQDSQFVRVAQVRDQNGQVVGIWKNEDDLENKYLYAMHPMSKAMHQIPRTVCQREIQRQQEGL